MKQWIALLFCAVLLLTMACPVWAEPEESTTLPTEESTTEPTVETTTEPTVETTTAPPVRYAVYLTIAYENKTILIRAKDVNGQPVRNAPVKVMADSAVFTGNTNDAGVATFPMAEEPAQIICSTEAFKGSVLHYEAASASVILHEPSSSTTESTTLTTEPSTAPTTEPSTAPTEPTTPPATVAPTTTPTTVVLPIAPTTDRPKTTYRTGTSVTWTTSDPLEGNVTVTEIITSSSVVEEEEEEEIDEQPSQSKSALPNGWALALMILGAVLLVVAAVVLCLFLVRAPRIPVEEKEKSQPEAEEIPAPVEEPAEETAPTEEVTEEATEDATEDATEEPTNEPETTGRAVSLEDLFRDL